MNEQEIIAEMKKINKEFERAIKKAQKDGTIDSAITITEQKEWKIRKEGKLE